MARKTPQEPRAEAVRLPQPERAELAHERVDSIDAPADSDTAEAWEREALRGRDELDAETATLVDRAEFRRWLHGRMRRR